MRRSCYTKILCVAAALVAPAIFARPQEATGALLTNAATAGDRLIRSFDFEKDRNAPIFYSQAYTLRGQRIEFQGSIFGNIQNVRIDRCKITIKSQIVDLYSGTIGRRRVGQTQTHYLATTEFDLTPKIAADLKIELGRPVRQLDMRTRAVCSGDGGCAMPWLKLKADHPVIHVTEITNDVADYDGDVQDFDGQVEQFPLPVSSVNAGDDLIGKMRVYAQSCSN